MKHICLLGSTGSIGRQTLEIVEKFPKLFKVEALTCNTNIITLSKQIDKFKPAVAVVGTAQAASKLKALLTKPVTTKILVDEEGLAEAVALPDVNLVVNAIVGSAGLFPTYTAIEAKKDIALANKETLVAGGEIIMPLLKKNKVTLVPIDSEHSAIFQCLLGEPAKTVSKLIITGSGGPFRALSAQDLEHVNTSAALKHPTFTMGAKITIDSATLMNKGLEIIEAHWLFNLPLEKIDVVMHPQSIVHSMVMFQDGSIKAQLGLPDMRVPIAYALSYPHRLPTKLDVPDFAAGLELTFGSLDMEKFPCLKLAINALTAGGTMPCVLNAANEIAVQAFLAEQISFTEIPQLIENVMGKHVIKTDGLSLSDIRDSDTWARATASEVLASVC